MNFLCGPSFLSRGLLLILVAVTTRSAAAATVPDFQPRVTQLCEKAARLRKDSDFEALERLRRERWDLVQVAAADPAHARSSWVVAYEAIKSVDGDSTIATQQVQDPGLLNRMDYKGACERLRNALKAVQHGDGPYLGELATRFFEAAQQARSCYQDALDPESPNCVATIDELKSALTHAELHDPCCVIATPMRLFITDPDPTEAFLRAELRPGFKQRQAELVRLSHPVTLPSDGQQTSPEHTEDAVLPWHAPVELDKAKSLSYLLQELDYTSYLTPEEVGPDYVLPGKVIMGRDGLSDPFTLLYGRYLVCRATDMNGRLRTAEMYLNAKSEWEYRYLDLLCRVPADTELPDGTELEKIINDSPAAGEIVLSGNRYVIRRFPIERSEVLISNRIRQFCVRDAHAVLKFQASPTENNPNALIAIASKKLDDVQTSPDVSAAVRALAQIKDKTKHPLVELMKVEDFNPLILVSDQDQADVKPHFLQDEQGRPYLELIDEQPDTNPRLVFDLDQTSDRAPCCFVEYPGASAFMPLHLHSIPLKLLAAGKLGASFAGILQDAGYSQDDAYKELQKCLEKTFYIPAKIKDYQRKSKSTFAQKLREKGWDGGEFFPPEVARLFNKYGFRHLRDRRENWIVDARFSIDQGVVAREGGEPDALDVRNYPFDFRAKDGIGRVDRRQIYSWIDYEAIQANVYNEHLRKLVMMHPCLPVWDVVSQHSSRSLVNPATRTVNYKTTNDLQSLMEADAGDRKVLKKILEQEDGEGGKLFFQSPCAAWVTADDEHQAATINNLHNEYSSRVRMAAAATLENNWFQRRYGWLDQAEAQFGGEPEVRKSLAETRTELDALFNQRRVLWRTIARTVIATQLESARYFARRKYYHLAMVHYNDLLLQCQLPRNRNDSYGVIANVANTDDAEKFADRFRELVEEQRLAVMAQLELGGVLNAGGLCDSAHAVWQRIVDDYEFFVEPTLRIAEDVVTSYGLRFSDRAKSAFKAYDDLVRYAEQAINRYKLSPDWIVLAPGKDVDRGTFVEEIGEIERVIALEQAGEAATRDDRRSFERALARIKDGRELTFHSWLRYRKALLPRGAQAWRSLSADGYSLHPAQFCPANYSTEKGFGRSVGEVLANADVEAVERCLAMAADDRKRSPDAVQASFLVGWYWLDAGQRSKARAAFRELAEVLESVSQSAASPAERLLGRVNTLSAGLGAASIITDMPGVHALKSNLSLFLKPQVLAWEREWFAASLYGPHATEEGRRIERQVDFLQRRMSASAAGWRSERYFLPDYTYHFGAVPDWLCLKALYSPQLFNAEVTEEDVAKLKGEGVEGTRWALLTPEHAKSFFDRLNIDDEVKGDIVELKH